MKKFKVTYRSRYYKMDTSARIIEAPSKKWIRDNWLVLMYTDEFVISKIEEVK